MKHTTYTCDACGGDIENPVVGENNVVIRFGDDMELTIYELKHSGWGLPTELHFHAAHVPKGGNSEDGTEARARDEQHREDVEDSH